jgi:hypothetical protein
LLWNFLLKHVLEGRIEETGKGPRRPEQLLDDFNETVRYWKLKEDVPDFTVWMTRFGRGYGRVVRQARWW